MLLAEGHAEELPESGHDVILEPFILGDGDDVVRVGLERGIRDLRVIVARVSPWEARIRPGLSSE